MFISLMVKSTISQIQNKAKFPLSEERKKKKINQSTSLPTILCLHFCVAESGWIRRCCHATCQTLSFLLILFKKLKRILMFIFERDRDRAWAGQGQRESETQNQKQAPGSRLQAVSIEPDVGLELSNGEIVTWAQIRCSTDWATQVPLLVLFFKLKHSWHTMLTCLSLNLWPQTPREPLAQPANSATFPQLVHWAALSDGNFTTFPPSSNSSPSFHSLPLTEKCSQTNNSHQETSMYCLPSLPKVSMYPAFLPAPWSICLCPWGQALLCCWTPFLLTS